jgi:hypothetical protein
MFRLRLRASGGALFLSIPIVRRRKDIFGKGGDGKLQSAFQKLRQRCGHSPSGVKTPYYAGLFGTAEAVPCYKTGD